MAKLLAPVEAKLNEQVKVASMIPLIQKSIVDLDPLYQGEFKRQLMRLVDKKCGPKEAHVIDLACTHIGMYGDFMRRQAAVAECPLASEETQDAFQVEPARCCETCGYIESYGEVVQARLPKGAAKGDTPPGAAIECCKCMGITSLKWKLPDGRYVDRIHTE
ncbi:MAG: hypothetical protein O3A29_04320 [Planctomycetota bacterium]|nr:hypothetical protein [Planctomycetota bacterium]